ncbi:uncharacterized protein LOC116618647 [Nematostella vectensis]|uniref:uncharacterized protein LOC116618647 n=1 Tax=Nematostella vectensis TaxID=45351 RepID=UPI002076D9AC|nr:uncharacterized protein LOC116618647 [Nematostella vectensis]XP_048586421.1 uncharacterized protein LOC116618647 [Nematostella vectensis]XP_048586422.1 uncharacterized protein LOC116618647 [Nematostella vectensis]XP_048586423.1 uncharacterized protein LOC116618647 [Nematostella vectensis]XP_048586424.1 uncharacterized protein LOC116618647 [Nematostella vectensis]XP_048586425.1 uncharacterized protein LOC116618647 [Nematostella vectensis]XP_048586426.1 uncharacterized protein LOC116618647 [
MTLEAWLPLLLAANLAHISYAETSKSERLREQVFSFLPGYASNAGSFKTLRAASLIDCCHHCLTTSGCTSGTFHEAGSTKSLCALINHTLTNEVCAETRAGSVYFKAFKGSYADPCADVKCKNGGTCVPDCSESGFKCQCTLANNGKLCNGWTVAISSCKDILEKTSHRKNMAYTFTVGSKETDVYCHMSSICGSGGWTLVMKIDGAKSTFQCASSYWSDKLEYNPDSGKTGFDKNETKLSTFWGVSFENLCLGMSYSGGLRHGLLTYRATSLYDVIADGTYRGTTAGRAMWFGLLAGSSLQNNCNREGFNPLGRIRLGIMSNQENDCNSPDSYIGFGYGSLASGNSCHLTCNNGEKTIYTFGYIFVK